MKMVYDDNQVRERIMKLMHRENLSQLDFAMLIKKPQPSVSEVMRGRRMVTKAFMEAILNAFPKLDKDWLMFGSKAMYKGEEIDVTKPNQDTRPRLPKTFAEGNIEAFLKDHRDECQEKPLNPIFPDYEFTLILKNDRMSPKYQRGDELAFRKTKIVEWGNDYLLDTVEGPKFKKVIETNDGGVRCISYNRKDYPEFVIPKDQIYAYYKCVGMSRVY